MKKGLIVKSEDSTDMDMKLINEYSRRTLTKDEVYTFSVVLCDNDIDRDFESCSALYFIKVVIARFRIIWMLVN